MHPVATSEWKTTLSIPEGEIRSDPAPDEEDRQRGQTVTSSGIWGWNMNIE